MTKELLFQAISKFMLGIVGVGLLIFLPAGTVAFWNAWLLLVVLFVPMFFAGIWLMVKKPELLKKRLQTRETQKEQDAIIQLSGLMFIVGFLIAGFDYRFGWFVLSKSISFGAVVIFLVAYLLYAEVIRENAYLSRIIEIQENQRVVDTGLYRVVRHPMYSASLVMFLAMPLILGSLYSFFVFLVYPFLLVGRIRQEEKLLEAELEGYAEYKKKVKYRLIPFVW